MSAAPIKWRYGTQLRSGRWIWPRGLWEYDLEKAKAGALRTWPHATVVGVEPLEPASTCDRWVHQTGKGWRLDDPSVAAAAGRSAPAIAPERMWWNRD